MTSQCIVLTYFTPIPIPKPSSPKPSPHTHNPRYLSHTNVLFLNYWNKDNYIHTHKIHKQKHWYTLFISDSYLIFHCCFEGVKIYKHPTKILLRFITCTEMVFMKSESLGFESYRSSVRGQFFFVGECVVHSKCVNTSVLLLILLIIILSLYFLIIIKTNTCIMPKNQTDSFHKQYERKP